MEHKYELHYFVLSRYGLSVIYIICIHRAGLADSRVAARCIKEINNEIPHFQPYGIQKKTQADKTPTKAYDD